MSAILVFALSLILAAIAAGGDVPRLVPVQARASAAALANSGFWNRQKAAVAMSSSARRDRL